MIQNILRFLFSIHKMMFQNLSSELCKNINDDEIIQISLTIINNDEENSELSILWAIKILKYHVNIDKEIIQSLLNNNTEINMMLYNITLKLKLVIQLNIAVVMKDVRNLKLSFIEYISDMIVRIEDMIVRQSFFIFEKDLNACILDQSFETITHMIRQTLNDESVHVTVFNSENDLVQAIFQTYVSDNIDDHYEYQVIEINTIQSIRKHLNTTCDT